MKKIMILAAAAALVFASCAKSEITSVNEENQHAIGFGAYTPRAITKAAAANYVAPGANLPLIANADFDVFGWITANGTSFTGSNGTKFFDSWYTVTFKADGNTDGTKNAYPDGLRYWPTGTSPQWLSFYAYYPSNGTGITAPAAGLGKFTFTAQAAAANQIDFMVSDVVKDKTYDNCTPTKGTVPLVFHHMLTKVVFKFTKTDVDAVVTITGASLSGIKNTGDLTTAFNGTTTSMTWDNQSGSEGYTVGYPTSALVYGTAYTSGNSADEVAADVLLMVPQTIEADTQKLTITWTVKSGSDATVTNTATIDLNDIKKSDNSHIDWAQNAQVTYTITVGPKPIYFTGSVDTWASVTNGSIEVN